MRMTRFLCLTALFTAWMCTVTLDQNTAFAASSAEIKKIEKLVNDTKAKLNQAKKKKNKSDIAFYTKKLTERQAALTKAKQGGSTKTTQTKNTKTKSSTVSSAEIKKLEKLVNDTKAQLNKAKKNKNKKDIAFYTKKLTERQASLAKVQQGSKQTDKLGKTTNALITKVAQGAYCLCAVEGKDDLKCRETNAKGVSKVVFNADPPAKHWNKIPKHCAPPFDPCVKTSEWQRSEWVTVWKTKWTRKTCPPKSYVANDRNGKEKDPTYYSSYLSLLAGVVVESITHPGADYFGRRQELMDMIMDADLNAIMDREDLWDLLPNKERNLVKGLKEERRIKSYETLFNTIMGYNSNKSNSGNYGSERDAIGARADDATITARQMGCWGC